ncbi:hypothetical protein TIFTF001_016951 [Ficus carica]|uniref:Uncharacterized protein n=1 Tax=Ficus carica TaxID=3494 RepID=A0AA88DIY1_FICCA|nr:hypothetical protein TIFTF001_016951 [Ficus carica]
MGEVAALCKWSWTMTAICFQEATIALRRSAGDRRRWWRQSTVKVTSDGSCVLFAGDEISLPVIYGGRCFCKWSFGYDREATASSRRFAGEQRRWWRQSTATISGKEEGNPYIGMFYLKYVM